MRGSCNYKNKNHKRSSRGEGRVLKIKRHRWTWSTGTKNCEWWKQVRQKGERGEKKSAAKQKMTVCSLGGGWGGGTQYRQAILHPHTHTHMHTPSQTWGRKERERWNSWTNYKKMFYNKTFQSYSNNTNWILTCTIKLNALGSNS